MAGYGRSDHRDILNQRNIYVRQHLAGQRNAGAFVMSRQIEEKDGSAAGQAVDGDAAQNNVCLVIQGEKRQHGRRQHCKKQGKHQSHKRALKQVAEEHSRKRGNEHHSLQRDVGDSGYIRDHRSHRCKEKGGRHPEDGVEKVCGKDQICQCLHHFASFSIQFCLYLWRKRSAEISRMMIL